MLKILAAAATVALLSVFPASVSHGMDKALLAKAGLQEIRQKAPDFSLKMGGRTISLADCAGKVAILHFWATWCKPCLEEFPLFEKMHRGLKDKDAVFLPVSIDAKAGQGEIDAFAKKLGAGFPVYLARTGNVTDRYWTWGVPVTYFIDKKGWIVGRALGPRDWAGPEILNLIEGLLKE